MIENDFDIGIDEVLVVALGEYIRAFYHKYVFAIFDIKEGIRGIFRPILQVGRGELSYYGSPNTVSYIGTGT